MIIQDFVIGIASIVFVLALIPMVLERKVPPLATSVPTSLGLLSITLSFATLDLYFSTAVTAATCMLWVVIAFIELQDRNTRE